MPSKKQEQKVFAGAATVCGASFLLLKRSLRESFLPETWGIPAGRVEYEEDPEAACARELVEETGLKGDIICLLGYSTFGSLRDDIHLSNVQLNFLVQVNEPEPADNPPDVILNKSSHSAAAWISLKKADHHLLDSFTREIFRSARDFYLRTSTESQLVYK